MVNQIELEYISGKTKIRKLFTIDNIELEEFIGKDGNSIKKYSSILYMDNWFKVNKSYEELKEIKINKSIPILGLASKSKKYK